MSKQFDKALIRLIAAPITIVSAVALLPTGCLLMAAGSSGNRATNMSEVTWTASAFLLAFVNFFVGGRTIVQPSWRGAIWLLSSTATIILALLLIMGVRL